jgi:hypothetical protein
MRERSTFRRLVIALLLVAGVTVSVGGCFVPVPVPVDGEQRHHHRDHRHRW